MNASVELGVFDLSRVPVNWAAIDPARIQEAKEAIDGSTREQCEQLQRHSASSAEAAARTSA